MPGRWALVPIVVLLVSTAGAGPAKPSPAVATPQPAAPANGSWTTYHHDDAHTGNDPAAPAVGAVAPTPGWTQTTLDGEVFAEPLIYNGIVYAATLNNTVYALNQSDGTLIWSKNVGVPQTSGWSCGNINPTGILGTPVIDAAANRIYVVAEITGTTPTYHLFGLDLGNLGSVVLDTTIAPTGFDWRIEQERGALGLRGGWVYVPFGGRIGDCGSYHGYVVGVPTSGSTALNVYQTPSFGSGLWGAGGVAVDDATGNVFGATGNGVAAGCSAVNQNDAVVRLSSTLALQDWFMPQDWQNNWCSNDQDLGSAGPLLISPNLLFQAGKWGGGFLLNPNSLGGVDGQLFPTPRPAAYSQADTCFGNNSDATFGSFAYAAPFVYVECEGQGLVALNVNTSAPSFSPCDAACAAPDWHSGGATTFGPPIVAGGAVWVANNGGGLYAFNATTGAQIFHSAGFGINRFVTPAEAGGQVFVPSHTVIKSFSFAPPAPPPPPATYSPVTPNRLLDTRTSGGPLGTGGSRNLTVTGGTTGVPTNATGVVMNVTATNTTAASFLTVYPAGGTRPLASNLNWVAGRTVPNLVEVTVGAGGAVTFFNAAGSTDVVADLEGYFSPSGVGCAGLGPIRLADTRPSSGQPNSGSTLGAGSTINVQVTGVGAIPATGVTGAILNVTVTNTTGSSFLTVWPTGAAQPLASNLNWVAGQTVPNRAFVVLGTGGMVSIYNAAGSTDVVVDASGYFTNSGTTGLKFNGMSPVRIADTRSSGQTLPPNGTFTLQVTGANGVPAGAGAIIANVTVTNTTAPSFLTVYPGGGSRPLASDLNWVSGQTIPNLTVATTGTTGAISFYNAAGSTDVVVDLVGYFN
jgi:outer membrane protein assembly factor BamB